MVQQRADGTSTVKSHVQRVVEAPVVGPCPRQEGRRDRGPGCRGDVDEGVARGAGRRVPQGGGGDAGEVDAERETCLLQGLLRHGKRLQLLLSVGHVGVLAAPTDAVQTRLERGRGDTHTIRFKKSLFPGNTLAFQTVHTYAPPFLTETIQIGAMGPPFSGLSP